MTESFTPLLTTTDWNAEWMQLQKARRHRDSAVYWDERAKTFTSKDYPNPYVNSFLERAGVAPEESVFDMGCGTGALALPLGEAGHAVMAADFSEGMLSILRGELEARGIKSVHCEQMSWEDDWEEHGIAPKSHDVCTASRSIAVDDMRAALLKLTMVARRRVCITLPTGASPRTDDHVIEALGLASRVGRDHLYAVNILSSMGFEPELTYIKSSRHDTFEAFDDALRKYDDMVRKVCALLPETRTQIALSKLKPWLETQIVENEDAGKPGERGIPQGALRLREPRTITWAFIAWNVD